MAIEWKNIVSLDRPNSAGSLSQTTAHARLGHQIDTVVIHYPLKAEFAV